MKTFNSIMVPETHHDATIMNNYKLLKVNSTTPRMAAFPVQRSREI